MKFNFQGSSNVVTPDSYLNMRIGDISRGILRYVKIPGESATTVGMVRGTNFCGTLGTATAPFDNGRTATHDVGHWLNLRHI